jgi:GH15 family glucan-1,4-alpha-glucosidase
MPTTAPSDLSAPALYLSNGRDLVGIWKARRLTHVDAVVRGPSLGELHYLGGAVSTRGQSQIVDATAFFRDETNGVAYTQAGDFESEAWLENTPGQTGLLVTRYTRYREGVGQPPCVITRTYAAVPDQPFFVIRTSLRNPGAGPVDMSVLEQVHLANVAGSDPAARVHATFDATRNALVADMSASGQFFVVLGALQPMDAHQVGDDADRDPASATASGWSTFDRDGTLRGNDDLLASDVDLAFVKRLTIPPQETRSVDLYLTVRGDLGSALAAADTARARSADAWFAAADAAHQAWLSNGGGGVRPALGDAGLDAAFERALLVVKNAQNPALGTFVAATNPIAYGYKNWVRDGSISAIALDASGHHAEAERYWRWMASVQGKDGAWKTTYGSWDGAYLSFVEPEYDSIGAFLYGVFAHYHLTGDAGFLGDLWPAVERAADGLLASLAPNGLGAADYSIWEEGDRGLQHHTFTQAFHVVGLWAAQRLAEIRGDTATADWYAGGPASILTALQRPCTWSPAGMWNPAGYYNRGVKATGAVEPLQDSSTCALVALGAVDPACRRAARHVATLTAALARDGLGMARYDGDDYYFSSPFDPAGDEVGGPSPSWPQMSMWVAIHEVHTGERAAALERLQWFASRTGAGYMPQGEAVSNVTHQSVLSSMCEPLTAASYVLAALCYGGDHDVRILPPIHNAGAFKRLAVAAGTQGDWEQWADVPYFVGALEPDARGAAVTIRRVFAANDERNLFLRVDGWAGALPPFREPPLFAVRVYAQDLAPGGAEALSQGLDGQPLGRPVSFAVERRSDEEVFRRWVVRGARWVDAGEVSDALPPQWYPALGRVEIVVPLRALATGVPAPGDAWATLAVALAARDAAGAAWVDGPKVLVHYRWSRPDQAWTYGNVEGDV